MAEQRKRQQRKDPPSGGQTPPQAVPSLSREDLESFSTLQLIDWIGTRLPAESPFLPELLLLRERVAEIEEINDKARETIEKLDEIITKLRSPAFRMGTLIMPIDPDKAHVCIGGSDYVCRLDPAIPLGSVQVGQRVLCNEAFAVVQALGFDRSGPVVRVDELLSDGRLRIGQESGLTPNVIIRSSLIAKDKLKPGMEVRLDPTQRVALEVLASPKRIDRTLETITELPWHAIGGQEQAVSAIRETIELPLLHPELFERFQHSVPKGFLLHGPPGCGKTLLGKATAYNLRQQLKTKTGVDHPEFFLHIKGPEILNMWVGESERQVRDMFRQCREKAAEGALAFLFIDEAESILGTRRAGRYNSVLSTVVPMFCTEMDGLDPLKNVVVILASNRADLIDPAILRPGRIDRKIKVNRPDRPGAETIYRIYLKDTLPLAEPAGDLARAVAEAHYAHTEQNRFLEVVFRSGRREYLHRGDLASGAIIAAIVERAKGKAIRRSIASKEETTITREDLAASIHEEYSENDLFPPTDVTEDWLKLTDFDPENVVKLSPIRPRKDQTPSRII